MSTAKIVSGNMCARLLKVAADNAVTTDGQAEPTSGPLPVLIIAYMRSGSSFTGDLFNNRKDAMYFFEPLMAIDKTSTVLRYPNGSKADTPRMETRTEIGLDVLQNIFRCNLQGVFQQVLESPAMDRGKDTGQYRSCVSGGRTGCLKKLTNACKTSSLIVAKTIRLRLFQIYRLLHTMPSLKIIHLLRDPRGAVQSRLSLFKTGGYFEGHVLCQEMEDDLLTADLFAQLFPNRIMRLLYEDLAENPLPIAGKIYEFCGVSFPAEARKWIYRSTSTGKRHHAKTFSTQRSNSSRTATEWRLKITWPVARFMDRQCAGVYARVGFSPFASERNLRNLNLSHRKKERT